MHPSWVYLEQGSYEFGKMEKELYLEKSSHRYVSRPRFRAAPTSVVLMVRNLIVYLNRDPNMDPRILRSLL